MIEILLAPDLSPAHLVGTGAAIGAILRHWVYVSLPAEEFPWPTLLVNVLGSFALGLLAFGGVGPATMQLLGVGCCGAFTTFSTFSVETVGLWERGERRVATANAVGTLGCSLAGLGVAGWLVG
ncbi:CrcB-like protein [Halovivax asiaticus JCM 14624]|uniref:Fluoride-specific ion channel FluC n=1 Tax=Halovivax asiaticus JCM 14624 TaxID=1227490 RepID=M0BKK7_9EURY|nr:CrcB family protein [Halovivax asiaticus]ELZ10843.1 CrcB-like protein [Halovivax asiaticus JCM 14624]